MDWFESLVGFREGTATMVRDRLRMDGTLLRSSESDLVHDCGVFDAPSLAELRGRASREIAGGSGSIRLREIVADVRDLHADPANAGATFQVASQFNFLEMMAPEVTPDDGVTLYASDATQGPACAVACGAATIYRNYLVPVDGAPGQTEVRQMDGLAEVGDALGQNNEALWSMQNGYALLTPHGRRTLGDRLGGKSPTELDALRGLLRVGVHVGAEVTLEQAGPSQRVSQVFGSAMPVAYGSGTDEEWRAIATLVLEASYEAALLQGVLNAEGVEGKPLHLTKLGGGAFGNDPCWIMDAIHRALTLMEPRLGRALDVVIVSYGRSDSDVRRLVETWNA
ncbi:MAG: hypothetical protein ACJAZN_002182 [Planctomycetota bacterium]|jgi:hypothetical protein